MSFALFCSCYIYVYPCHVSHGLIDRYHTTYTQYSHRRRAAAAKQKAEQKGGKVSEEEESGEEKEEDMEEWEGEEEGEEYPEDEEEEEGSKTKAGPSSFLRVRLFVSSGLGWWDGWF